MKIYRMLTCFVLAVFCTFLCFGCGGITTNITLGVYDPTGEGTFTALTGDEGYSLIVNGTNLILEGNIPYSELTIEDEPIAGNIVAIRFKPSGVINSDDETSFQTSNGEGGWDTHGEEFIEDDGSIVWIVSVAEGEDYQIKIKWNANYTEVTYTLTLDDEATLEEPEV